MKHNYLSFLSLVRAGSALLLLASVTLLALGQFLWGVGVLVLSLAACSTVAGLLGDESDRMATYIQGYLDMTYKGQFNEDYMEELSLTEEDMQERYENGLKAEAQFFETAIGYIEYPTEESTQRLMELYARIYSYSDYTVESCTKLESGNYVHFDYLTLGWTPPLREGKLLKSIRLAFTVNNLGTLSAYSGLTPLINSTQVDSTLGVDDKRTYPLSRTYTLSLSLNF